MNMIWGLVVLVLSLLAWAGQALAWLAPSAAVRWQLMEAESDVEPTFWVDIRAEARWDALTLWVMVVAGVLLIADVASWPYFGLVGGGIYLYFGGRGISARVTMARQGLRIRHPRERENRMHLSRDLGCDGPGDDHRCSRCPRRVTEPAFFGDLT